MKHFEHLRSEYPNFPEADLEEIYFRTTNLIWQERWDGDELALRSYYRNGNPDLPTPVFRLQREAVLETLTKDVLKTSEIEGEKLDAEQVDERRGISTEFTGNHCCDRLPILQSSAQPCP